MSEVIAYCGLACQSCPIFLATRQEDKEEQSRMRAEIARQCKEQYGLNFAFEDITDCDGCTTEGERLFSACKDCPIRKCARDRGLENCAYCQEYACHNLEAFLKTEAMAKARLDTIRNSAFQ